MDGLIKGCPTTRFPSLALSGDPPLARAGGDKPYKR